IEVLLGRAGAAARCPSDPPKSGRNVGVEAEAERLLEEPPRLVLVAGLLLDEAEAVDEAGPSAGLARVGLGELQAFGALRLGEAELPVVEALPAAVAPAPALLRVHEAGVLGCKLGLRGVESEGRRARSGHGRGRRRWRRRRGCRRRGRARPLR